MKRGLLTEVPPFERAAEPDYRLWLARDAYSFAVTVTKRNQLESRRHASIIKRATPVARNGFAVGMRHVAARHGIERRTSTIL